MAKAPKEKDTLSGLWRAITPFCKRDHEYIRGELDRIKRLNLPPRKAEALHRRLERLCRDMFALLHYMPVIEFQPKQIEEALRYELGEIKRYRRMPAHPRRRFSEHCKILDLLLDGRAPDTLTIDQLVPGFRLAAEYVYGKMGRDQARAIVIRYRKRFGKVELKGVGTLTIDDSNVVIIKRRRDLPPDREDGF